MNTDELLERAYHIIHSNRYLTMATCDGQQPWAAPLCYVVNSDYSLIFYSAVDSRHSQHIARNPAVACTIFDSTASSDDADGIQFSALVQEVEEKGLERVMKMYFEQSFPDEQVRQRWVRPIEDFTGTAIQRFYRIVPLEMFTLDFTIEKVDRRVAIDLEVLKQWAPAQS